MSNLSPIFMPWSAPFELQNIWSHSQSWWCVSFWHSFKCNYAITSVIAMFQRITPRWRYEVFPQVQRCFQLLLEFTRSWNVFEQYCPWCDLNVFVHWLSFFEPLVLRSPILHIIIFLCPPADLNTACFFLFRVHWIAPKVSQLFKKCREELMSFHVKYFADSIDVLHCSTIFLVLESNLILQRLCLFKSNCWNEIRKISIFGKDLLKIKLFGQRPNTRHSM